ncbi:MAG: cache domain-containing protein [Pseudomonadota bacterium]
MKSSLILNPRSLAGTGFLSVLLTIIAMTMTVGSLWIYEKYNQKQAQLESIRENFTNTQKSIIHREVERTVDFIRYKRNNTENRIKENLRSNIATAYTLASHIYSTNLDMEPQTAITEEIVETLRQIRWDNGKGYFFIVSLDGTSLMNADRPGIEGKNLMNEQDTQGKHILRDMIDIIRKQNSGFYSYTWTKPGSTGEGHKKIAFVKYFAPLNFLIGTGYYIDDMETEIKEEVLARISNLQFPKNQYIFVIRYDGLIINHPMEQYRNRYLFNNPDDKEYSEIRELINVVKQDGGGYMTYIWEKPETGVRTPKLTYGASINDWEWVICHGIYLDDLQKIITGERKKFTAELRHEFLLLSAAFILCLVCSLIAGIFVTQRLQKGVSVFIDFFKKATVTDIKINRSALTFHEFEILGDLANQMVEDRIQKEKALRKSVSDIQQLQSLLQNITDSMPSLLIAVDRDMNVLQWNREAERTTGILFNQAEHRKFQEILPLTTREHQLIQRTLTTGFPCFETRVQKTTDTGITFEDITVYPLGNDPVGGAVVRIDDITEKVRLEEIMIQSEKMLSVGGLAAGMAHEINNPLAGIMGSLHVLDNRLMTDLPANQAAAAEVGVDLKAIQDYMVRRQIRPILDNIRQAGSRAATIVSDMLSFSRQSPFVFSPVSLAELMDKTVDLASTDYDLKNRYDFRRIRIVRNYTPDMGPVMCESSKIQQVFLNILSNGAQAMSLMDKGHMPEFVITIRPRGDKAVIVIKDNGPGMTKDVVKRVFEPFFTTKEVGLGTGLGLSVSYFIVVDHHKGSMGVTSNSGQGAEFTICLPITREE